MALSKEQEQKYLKMVREDGLDLEYIEEQTPELRLEAVKQNRQAFYFINNQTKEMKSIKEILDKNDVRSYREIRSQLASGEIEQIDSPYHVLDCLGF